MDPTTAGTPSTPPVSVVVAAPGVDPAALWRLLATPDEWPRWAPHIRRVVRASSGAATSSHSDRAAAPTDVPVRVGDRVRIDSWWPVHVTAVITHVDAPVRWDFRVDLPLGHHLVSTHDVLTDPVAARVQMYLEGPVPDRLASGLLTGYRPLALCATQRLVALARA